MKTIFLSFSPDWYPYIESGEKVYEHRKRFCVEPVRAYLYLGLPIQKVVAIIELGERIPIATWLTKYQDDVEAVRRVEDFLARNKYAMEIRKVSFIEPIPVQRIIDIFPKFHIPQSFFYLDKKPELLDFLRMQTKYTGRIIENHFDNIKSEDICRL